MSETKTIMTNTAFDAAEQIAIEQTARNAEANMENYAASAIAQVANAASAAIAAVSIVDVGSNANIQYIADHCAQWTDGSLQTLPDGTQITYHTTTTYIGSEPV